MRVIIAGSRKLKFYITDLKDFIEEIHTKNNNFYLTEVVSGNSGNIDKLGEQYAVTYGYPVKLFPANWKLFGLITGMKRNKQMAEYANALIAIWDGESRGTLNMITQMRELRKPVYVKVINK